MQNRKIYDFLSGNYKYTNSDIDELYLNNPIGKYRFCFSIPRLKFHFGYIH